MSSQPEINVKEYTEHGIATREELCPEGWTVIDTYHPTSSVTPWDYYGNKHQREYAKVLREAGVQGALLMTRKTIVSPIGTGPNGRVRMGDNMCPGVYRIAVPSNQEAQALSAIAQHKEAISLWLDGKSPMPEACRQ